MYRSLHIASSVVVRSVVVLFGLWLLLPAPAAAQPNDLEKLYGKGVHAYNDGRYDEAAAYFDEAVELGTRDPRIWYFRGIVKQTNGGDGSEDFRKGASLEFATTGRFFDIGRSLEKIQGNVRLKIEDARRSARTAARAAGPRAKPEGSLSGLPIVPNLVPGVRVIPQTNFPDTRGKQYPNTPFAQVPAGDASPAAAQPAPVTDDPFPVETPQPDTGPEDPFGEEMPAEPAAGSDDPFAEGSDADGDNPFGDNPSGEDPDESGGDDDDPFGDG